MSVASMREVQESLPDYIEQTVRGEVVTITRQGEPVAALVPISAAKRARESLVKDRPSLGEYLLTIPEGEFERDRSPSRDVDL